MTTMSREKLICSERTHMEQIPVLTVLPDAKNFLDNLKRVSELRHSFYPAWHTWVERLHRRPNADILEGFPGARTEAAQEMGRDVWSILVLKVKEAVRSIVDRASRETDDLLLRVSIAMYDMLTQSRGQMSTRIFSLLDAVTHPKMAMDWSAVPDLCRKWENDLTDYQGLTGLAFDPNMKTEAFLRILPVDLRNLALSQQNLEKNFENLRDYIYHQVGRRAALDTHTATYKTGTAVTETHTPMDISAMIKTSPSNNASVPQKSAESDWHDPGA